MALDDVAAEGNQLATLKELRDLLAIKLATPGIAAADMAALTGRLVTVLEKIAAIEPDAGEGTALDELTKRRQAREASHPAGAAKRNQRR